jgi:hypothetical protein
MTDTVDNNLLLDLLERVGRKERTYQETMDAWRTLALSFRSGEMRTTAVWLNWVLSTAVPSSASRQSAWTCLRQRGRIHTRNCNAGLGRNRIQPMPILASKFCPVTLSAVLHFQKCLG